jgi:hypothetical protein
MFVNQINHCITFNSFIRFHSNKQQLIVVMVICRGQADLSTVNVEQRAVAARKNVTKSETLLLRVVGRALQSENANLSVVLKKNLKEVNVCVRF